MTSRNIHIMDEETALEQPKAMPLPVRPRESRYPYCIVWTPLPPITWFLPFIGHMGIATSTGVIYDFAGPYYIGEDNMAFGQPTRYLQLDPKAVRGEDWDRAVAQGCADYRKRMHNICCDNCHSHVARCMNYMQYAGYKSYNMVILCFWLFFRGKYVGVSGFLKSWVPFLILLGAALAIRYSVFS